MLMSPTLIHYYMDHFSLLFCLSVTSNTNSDKPCSNLLPFTYLIFQSSIYDSGFRIIKPYPQWKKTLLTRAQCLCTAFSLADFTYFQNYLGQPFQSPHLSMRLFYTFVMQRGSFQSCIPSQDFLTSQVILCKNF